MSKQLSTLWGGALVAGILFRLWDLGRQSLSMDEVWEIQVAVAPWSDIHLIDDGFPPLFHYILKPAIAAFGYSAPRWIAAAAGIATLYFIYRLADRVRPGLGLPAAALLSWMPLHLHLSREGRVYALVILAAAAAFWWAQERRWFLYGLALISLMWMHYGMAALAAVLAAWTLLETRRSQTPGSPDGTLSPDRRAWWITHVVVGLLALPLIFPLLGDLAPHTTVSRARGAGPGEFLFLGKTLLFGFALGPSARELHTLSFGEAAAAILPSALLLVPAGIWVARRGWQRTPAVRPWVGIGVAGLVLTTVLIVATGIGFQVRYFAWLIIPLTLWLAAGIESRRVTVVALAVLGFAMVFSAMAREFDPDHQTEDSRAVAEFIAAESDPAFGLAWYMSNPTNFYLTPDAFLPLEDPREATDLLGPRAKPGQRVRPLSTGVGGSEPHDVLTGLMAQDIDEGDRYLLIYSRTFHGDDDGSFRRFLEAEDGLEVVYTAAGIEVLAGIRSGS